MFEVDNMKVVAVLCFFFAISQTEGRSVEPSTPKQFLSPLQEQCIKELKLEATREDIANLNHRAICPEDNPNYNKFISCFWKKTNRQSEDGAVNYDTIKLFVREGITQALGNDPAAADFAEEHSGKIVKGCKAISGESPEKTAVKVRNCIVRGLDEIGKIRLGFVALL